ncbi:beta-N-acetylhexosaminidase [Bacillus sp. AK031]
MASRTRRSRGKKGKILFLSIMIPLVLMVFFLDSECVIKGEMNEDTIQNNPAVTSSSHPSELLPASSNANHSPELMNSSRMVGNSVALEKEGKVSHTSFRSLVKEDEPSADQILTEMSLDEKIGQLIISGVEGTSVDLNDKRLITDIHVGGVIFYSNNIESVQQTKQMVEELKATNAINKLPLFISVDQEGGSVSRLPGVVQTPANEEIGETNDKKYAFTIGERLGENLKSLGFNLDYAPVLDINSNPDNPVIGDRSYGSNASVVTDLGIQTMKGIQSKDIISVIKHFPGHGDTSVDSHIQLPVVNKNLNQLKNLELIPFKKAIQNGADMVMVAHILLPQLDNTYPASMSKVVMTNVLRNQLNFNGVIITDDMTMGAIVKNFGIGDAAVDSLQAGSDIILVAHEYKNAAAVFNSIKTAVEKGELSEQRIDESVERVINIKRNYLN